LVGFVARGRDASQEEELNPLSQPRSCYLLSDIFEFSKYREQMEQHEREERVLRREETRRRLLGLHFLDEALEGTPRLLFPLSGIESVQVREEEEQEDEEEEEELQRV